MAIRRDNAVYIDALLSGGAGIYGKQLSAGYRVQFRREIEQEYRQALGRDARRTVPIAIRVCLLLWTGLLFFDIWRLSQPNDIPGNLVATILAIRIAVLVALAIYLVPAVRRIVAPDWALMVLLTALGIVSAITGAIYHVHGIANASIALIIIVMVTFLPIGPSLVQAVIVSTVIILARGIVESPFMFDTSEHDGGLLGPVLLVATFISAIAYLVRDRTQRDHFLLERVLTHVAQHDPLTGLANRRLFADHVAKALAHARREREPVALALVDIDFFKRYNDTYGHAAGDEVLRQVAGRIGLVGGRPLDLSARVGGEEFAVFLYGAEMESARTMLEGLVDDVRALAIPHSTSAVAEVLTVSVGLAMAKKEDDLPSIYRKADIALYSAKDSGRNRVAFFSHDTAQEDRHELAARQGSNTR